MGEEFYERVIGFSGKREGSQIAYRGGHALLYSPSGNKAGQWHSFGSGEGGAPIQLLMSSTHGWGLSREDALKEGASIAGLIDVQTQIIRKTPKRTQPVVDTKKEQQEEEKRERRIAAARYYYQSAQPIDGTIGETYLRKIRGIEGDISSVRYHPRIRDSRVIEEIINQHEKGKTTTETKYITTYHPGIVVAAYNRDGEFTGGQTIILDPKTCDKADKDIVGVVKRSRGVVKGSAVQIQIGTGNKVIIAEGNETALSLVKAEPDANIYVTLGNIKNAALLQWLADKHHTKEFYFAADNDGINANNLKALREVAKELKYDHGIDCYMALPYIAGKEKTDFNDVLREKGQEEVAKQLADMKLIKVPERKTIVHGDELHDRLQQELGSELGVKKESIREQSDNKTGNDLDNAKKADKELQKPVTMLLDSSLGWNKLQSVDNEDLELILRYKKIAANRANKEDRAELNEPVGELIEYVAKNKRVMDKIKEKAPKIADYFSRCSKEKTVKEPMVDWKKDEYKKEWDKLRGLDKGEGALFYLIKFRDIAHKKQDPEAVQRAYGSMNDLIKDVIGNKKLFEKAQKESPLLAGLFQSHAKGMERYIGKVKGRGRDR